MKVANTLTFSQDMAKGGHWAVFGCNNDKSVHRKFLIISKLIGKLFQYSSNLISCFGHGSILRMTSLMQCSKIEIVRHTIEPYFRVFLLESVKSLLFFLFRFLEKDIATLNPAITSVVSRDRVSMVERALSYATTPNKNSTAPAQRNILVNYARSEELHPARNKRKDTRGRCLVSIHCLMQQPVPCTKNSAIFRRRTDLFGPSLSP